MKLPPGKTLYQPQGRDPILDTCILADAVVASDADLLNDGGAAVWIHDGRRSQIGMEVLREIISQFIVTVRLVEHDGMWSVEFPAVVPDNNAMRLMLTADRSNGGLIHRLPKHNKPTGLSARDEHDVRVRMGRGESAKDLAREFGSNAAALEQLVR